MAAAIKIEFSEDKPGALASAEGAAIVFWSQGGDGQPVRNAASRWVDNRTKRQLSRVAARAKTKGETGEIAVVSAPHRMAADTLVLVRLGGESLDAAALRGLGGKIAAALDGARIETAHLRVEGLARRNQPKVVADLLLGLRLRSYRFNLYKGGDDAPRLSQLTVGGVDKTATRKAWAPLEALAQGVELTRDLVNEPANVLTPADFAKRAARLADHGVKVDILREAELKKEGMRTLLAVGEGSEQESHVAVMRWMNAPSKKAPPFCLIGKGVCFDTGGISLKPPAGMEEMTMDMGGAGVVVGAMKALALRKAKVNAIGVIGLVENMPDGRAQRPGDIVKARSGATIEVINTDAEGRLVLADLLDYAQDKLKPAAMVDLATLTGAIIVALGHEKAGLFSNNDDLAQRLTAAAGAEGEGIWRLPLGPAYDKALKSRLADMKNVGGRAAGSITAAQFLQRFVKEDAPWAHLDIAGVALTKENGPVWPKGASGWGVATLVRLVEEHFAA